MGRPGLSDADVAAIRDAAGRADVREAIRRFYAELDAAVQTRQPVCRNRGACCRFDEFGHELFVTTLEAAYFLATVEKPIIVDRRPAGCPYQINGMCTARDARPSGCRIFFCDATAQSWQGPMTEQTLKRLRELHEQLDVPYRYAEWRDVLAAIL
jgi:hypothetical protein